jgi:hypothetical protein
MNAIEQISILREALQELLYAWDQDMNPFDGVAEDAREALEATKPEKK